MPKCFLLREASFHTQVLYVDLSSLLKRYSHSSSLIKRPPHTVAFFYNLSLPSAEFTILIISSIMAMNLSEEQILTLKERAANGAQLNDLQKTIQNDFSMSITYMETRFLMSDLGINILSPEELAPEEPTLPEAPAAEEPSVAPEPPQDLSSLSNVKVSVDQVTRPGAMVNGSVTWSDGVTSAWAVDQMGRLALDSADENYQPSPNDIEDFQLELRKLLGA